MLEESNHTTSINQTIEQLAEIAAEELMLVEQFIEFSKQKKKIMAYRNLEEMQIQSKQFDTIILRIKILDESLNICFQKLPLESLSDMKECLRFLDETEHKHFSENLDTLQQTIRKLGEISNHEKMVIGSILGTTLFSLTISDSIPILRCGTDEA